MVDYILVSLYLLMLVGFLLLFYVIIKIIMEGKKEKEISINKVTEKEEIPIDKEIEKEEIRIDKETGKFEVYKDKAGEYRFRLKAPNGEIIAVSEGYKAKKSCMNGIKSVKRNVINPKIVELTE